MRPEDYKKKEKIPGLYRARVEYINDPLEIDRVKVRVPKFHGIPEFDEEDEYFKIRDLPWARRCTVFAGYDIGDSQVPPVGSIVYVMFETGDIERPVYMGGVHGTESEVAHTFGCLDPRQELPVPDDIPAGQWDAPVGENEVPKDAREGREDHIPTKSVLYKSLKGHTIYSEDKDEKESFTIIDRAGQAIKFISPILWDENHTGDESFQRGIKSTEPGYQEDQFDYEDESFQSTAIMFLRDLAGQLIRTVAEYGKERIEIVSHNYHKDDDRRVAFEMNSGESNVNYMLLAEDEELDNRVYIYADAIEPKLELVVVEGGEEISRQEMTDDILQYATGETEIQSIDRIRIHTDDEMNITADGGDLEMSASGEFNRQSGGEMNNMAGGNFNTDAPNIHLNSGTSSPYGGEFFDYEPPSDNTTWSDELPERFVD